MSEQEITIALAQIDGWFVGSYPEGFRLRHIEKCVATKPYTTKAEAWDHGRGVFYGGCTTSFDAIIPLIQKQDLEIRVAIERDFLDRGLLVTSATPKELCVVLLKKKGLWRE